MDQLASRKWMLEKEYRDVEPYKEERGQPWGHDRQLLRWGQILDFGYTKLQGRSCLGYALVGGQLTAIR